MVPKICIMDKYRDSTMTLLSRASEINKRRHHFLSSTMPSLADSFFKTHPDITITICND
jgi:hypothetical protein